MQNIIFLAFSGILLGAAYITSKILSEKKYDAATVTASYGLFSAIFIAPFAFKDMSLPQSFWFWVLSVGSPIIFSLGFFFSIKAYEKLEVSVVSLIGKLNLIFATVFGILLIHDPVPKYIIIAIFSIFIGSTIILYEKGKFKITPGVVWALLTALSFSIIAIADKKILEQFSPLTYVFFNNMIVSILFFSRKIVRKEFPKYIREFPIHAIANSLFGVTSWASFIILITKTSVIWAYPMWESVALLTIVIVGILFLNEKDRMWQKITGTVITIVGIVLLSL